MFTTTYIVARILKRSCTPVWNENVVHSLFIVLVILSFVRYFEPSILIPISALICITVFGMYIWKYFHWLKFNPLNENDAKKEKLVIYSIYFIIARAILFICFPLFGKRSFIMNC